MPKAPSCTADIKSGVRGRQQQSALKSVRGVIFFVLLLRKAVACSNFPEFPAIFKGHSVKRQIPAFAGYLELFFRKLFCACR